MDSIMKYKNVLGKDFKTKPEAYKYFRDKIGEFKIDYVSNYVVLTEETPIKQSQMIQLAKDYGSYTQEWEDRKSHSTGIKEWCVMRNTFSGIESFSLGFLRNRKEHESKFNEILPESVTAKKIFTCFGKGEFNKNEILNSALRNEIRPQTKHFRENSRCFCLGCEQVFSPHELVVDHIFEFKNIVKEFLKNEGWKEFMQNSLYKESNGVLYRLQDVSPDFEFYPDSPKTLWQEFHKQRATLQMLCKSCHDSKTYAIKIKGSI